MLNQFVIPFDDPRANQAELTGGKGANLAVLVADRFPVPPGFTVATDAYSEFIAENDLGTQLSKLAGQLTYDKPEVLETESEEIRALFLNGKMPVGVTAEIEAAYEELGGPFVAVRSSGTAEDTAQASFAGMHDTYLDIRGADEVIAAVQRCWASMWTARATSYRHTQGFEHTTARLAVVVQVMIESEVSGVMFTANPLTARTDEMVINASWGLGEAIVSGIVTPDELTLDLGSLAVKNCNVGTKEVQVLRRPDGAGTRTDPVPAAKQGEVCLPDGDAAQLGRLGRRVMERYGGLPQDIEWAFADGSFYLLQTRPVTGVEFTWDDHLEDWQHNPETDDTVWSQKWAEEFWAGAISPLFYSVRGREFLGIITRMNELWGFEELNQVRHFKYRRGTAYYNAKVDTIFYSYVLPPSLRLGALGYLPDSWKAEAAATPLDINKFARMQTRVNLLTPEKRIYNWHKTVREYFDNRVEEANGLTSDQLADLTDAEVKAYLARMIGLAESFMEQLWNGIFIHTHLVFAALGTALAKWYDGDNPLIFHDLISGLPATTLMNEESHALWKLADAIRQSPRLTELFAEHQGEAFFAAAAADPEGVAFTADYTAFVAAHGHRGHADRDLYFPRRLEDPGLDYQTLQVLLSGDTGTPPWEMERELNQKREGAAAGVVENIRRKPLGGLKAEAFKVAYAHVLDFLVLREDWRHWIDRVTFAKKRGFVELGRRCVERGYLEDAGDCFFLSEAELYSVLDGHASLPLTKAKIAARRRVFHAFAAREEIPPLYLQGHQPADIDGVDEHGEGILHGLGTSRGYATGRARVIPELKDIGRIEKGDILVCSGTDPGWASAFTIMNGLVMEVGGMLAHGSCLSREHGLPAVLVRNAMKLIPDGAMISVNGDTGEICLLDQE